MASSPTQPLAIIAKAVSSAVAEFGRSSNAITTIMATRIPIPMADGQHSYTVARAKFEFAQGLADQSRLRRQHDFRNADFLQRLAAVPFVQSAQFHKSLSIHELLHLVFAGDHKDGVVGLKYRLRKGGQESRFAVRMFLETYENNAEAVESMLYPSDRPIDQGRVGGNAQSMPAIR